MRVTGRVIDEAGNALRGARVAVSGFEGPAAPACAARTGDDGRFVLDDCARRSWLLHVEHDGFFPDILPIDLQRRLGIRQERLPSITLTERRPGRVRLLFGGDVMMGRRFVNRSGTGNRGGPEDGIHPATEAHDMDRVLGFLRESLGAADVTVVNLETPVTKAPTKLHDAKAYAFSSGPSLPGALVRAGVDVVSIGNNHLYDALDPGVVDTLENLRSAGLRSFGGGTSESEAAASAWVQQVRGVDLALQGFTSVVAPRRPAPNGGAWPVELLYVARDEPVLKGGALELTPAHVDRFLESAHGSFAVPVFHGGIEYSDVPDATLRQSVLAALREGAGLVVVHHPHTAQGLGWIEVGGQRRWVIASLGNLVFDQEVFDTFQGYTAVVDVDQGAGGIHEIHRIRLVPHHLEDYVPKLLTGASAAREARRIARLSGELESSTGDGLRGSVVSFDGLIALADTPTRSASWRDTSRSLTTTASKGDSGPIVYERIVASDSLARIVAPGARRCSLGRDLLVYGDFEDGDVDDQTGEAPHWGQGAGQRIVHADAYAGTSALALLRQGRAGLSGASFRYRIPFPAGRALTVRAVARGESAGELRLRLAWHDGRSPRVIKTETVLLRVAGTYGWGPVFVDLNVPFGSKALGLAVEQGSDDARDGVAWLDDVALIAWESCPGDASQGVALATPNAWDFFRVQGPSSTSVTLVHRYAVGRYP